MLNFCKRYLKQLILKFLYLLPFSSEVIGSPKGVYKHTLDYINSHFRLDFGKNYIEIYPKHWIHRLKPKTLYKETDWRFSAGYLGDAFETPSTFVAVIPNGRVCGGNGAVITSDDKLLADVSIEFGVSSETIENHSILQKIKLPALTHTDENVAILAAVGGTNYFHWMFDVIPRIHLLRRTHFFDSVDKFVVNKLLYSFQKETLDILEICEKKIIETDDKFHLRSNQLIIPSLCGITGSMPRWTCEFLKKEFLLEQHHLSHKKERIYISRNHAKTRKIINENQLIDCLTQFNFKIYTMENLSVVEQASIFSSAEVIVSPHGAALTNLVFCNPQTKLIEIFSPKYVNPCYRGLSNLVDVDYWYLLGEGQASISGSAKHLDITDDANIQVDISYLTKILEQVCT